MAVAFRSSSTGTANLPSATLGVNAPAGLAQNDLMIAALRVHDSAGAASITPPSGWTQIQSTSDGTGNLLVSWYKVATGSEPGSYNWGLSSNTGGVGTIDDYTGANTANPIDTSNGQANASSSSITAPGITVGSTSGIVVGIWAQFNGTATITVPSGFTPRAGVDNSSSVCAIQTGEEVFAAGATGNQVASSTATAINEGHLISINAGVPLTPVALTQPPDPSPAPRPREPGHFGIDVLEQTLYFSPPLMGYGNITQTTPANPPAPPRQTGFKTDAIQAPPKITPVFLTIPPPPNPPAPPRQLGWKADPRYFVVNPTPPKLVALQAADPAPRRRPADPGHRAEVIAAPSLFAIVPPLSWANNEQFAEPYPKHPAQPQDWSVGSPAPIATPAVPTPNWLFQTPDPLPKPRPRDPGLFVQPQITFWGQMLTALWWRVPDPAYPPRPTAQPGWFATGIEKSLYVAPTPTLASTLQFAYPAKAAVQEGWSVFASQATTKPTPPVAALTRPFDLFPPRPPAQQGHVANSPAPGLVVPTPPVSWKGIEPTLYPPRKPMDEGQSRLVLVPSQIGTPGIGWIGSFQYQPPAAKPKDAGWQIFPIQPALIPPPPTAWFPLLPPQVQAKVSWNLGHFALDLEPSTFLLPPPMSWQSRTPDPLRTVRPADPGWHARSLVPIVVPVSLSWQGRFPDGQPLALARQVGWITTPLVPIGFPPTAGWMPATGQVQPPMKPRQLGFEAEVLIIPARMIPFVGGIFEAQGKKQGDQTGFYTFPFQQFQRDIYTSSWLPCLPLVSPLFKRADGWFAYVILPPGVPPFPAQAFPDVIVAGRGEVRLWVEPRHARTFVELRKPRVWKEPKRFIGGGGVLQTRIPITIPIPGVNMNPPVFGPSVGINPGTDITQALQAWINATAAADSTPSFGHPGASWLYLPKGVYTLSATIDWSPLQYWGLLGDPYRDTQNSGTLITGSINGPLMQSMNVNAIGNIFMIGINLRNTFGGTPVVAPFNNNPALSYAISGCGIAFATNAQRVMATACQFNGMIGVQHYSGWISEFSNCNFNASGNVVGSIGLLAWGPTACSANACNFVGWDEGFRAAGTGFSVTKSRFEVNRTGMRLGCDPAGASSGLNRSAFVALSMEANTTHVYVENCANCNFESIGASGSTNAPGGNSVNGLHVGFAQGCTFSGIGLLGTYVGGVALQLDDNSSKGLTFDGVQANSNGPPSWYAGPKNNTNIFFRGCNRPIDSGGTTYYQADAFVASSGTALEVFDPVWTNVSGDLTINTSQAISCVVAGTTSLYVRDTFQSNITLTARVQFSGATTQDIGIIVRYQDSNNYWLLFADYPGQALSIYENVAGVLTLRATAAYAWAGNTPYDLAFICSGTTLSGYVNQSPIVSFSSSDLMTATKVGIRMVHFGETSEILTFKVTSP